MLQLEVSGIHFELDDKTKQYALDKIGGLDRYFGRKVRGNIVGHVILTDNKSNGAQRFSCEVTLQTPDRRIVAKELTPNTMFSAIDLAEGKIKAQITKYKSRREAYQHRLRGLIRRFRRTNRP